MAASSAEAGAEFQAQHIRIPPEKSLSVSQPSRNIRPIPYDFAATILVAGSSAIILKAKCAPPPGCSRSGSILLDDAAPARGFQA